MANPALKVSAPTKEPADGLDDDARDAVAAKFSTLLADTHMLLMKTQGVHWNVAGPEFYGVRKLTEEHYEALHRAIDMLAKRVRTLGREAPLSHPRCSELSKVGSMVRIRTAAEMVRLLANDHEAIARSICSAIPACEDRDDYASADLLSRRLAWHEKADWMLRALLAD